MNLGTPDPQAIERQSLLNRLLDAVKQCQIRFGGKSELATESDSRVCCLCSAWESVLQHGMKHTNKALSTLKQVTEITGLTRIGSGISLLDDIKNMETEPVFFYYVKEFLGPHESKRYGVLKNVNTDAGRGRAWLRSALNEHSLERYTHMFVENKTLLSQYYEDWAFLRDHERSSALPNMAAGLGSIFFATSIDNGDLNTIKAAQGLNSFMPNTPPVNSGLPPRTDEEPRPVIAGDGAPTAPRKKEKKKKKKLVNIVSFEEDDGSPGSSVSSSFKSSTSSSIKQQPASVSAVTVVASKPGTTQPAFRPQAEGAHAHGAGQEVALNSSSAGASPDMGNVFTHSPKTQRSNQTDIDRDIGCGASHFNQSVSSSRVPPQNSADSSVSPISVAAISVHNSDLAFTASPVHQQATSSTAARTLTKLGSVDSVESALSFEGLKHSPSQVSNASNVSENSYGDEAPTVLTPLDPVDGPDENGCMVTCVVGDDNDSYDSNDMPNYSEDTQTAALALALAQKGYIDSESLRTQGDGSHAPEPISPTQDAMTTGELKQAVIAMMLRKDEVEQQNRTLQAVLNAECETSTALRLEMEEMRKIHLAKQEKDAEKIKGMGRENELLKHQLRKYVNAVQLLRRDGTRDVDLKGIHLEEVQPAIPPAKETVDYSLEASEYEKKLIQVAEMHGELMEFNELLHRQLLSRDAQLRQLRQELTTLRGPLPRDIELLDNDDVVNSPDASNVSSARRLVNIWIPSAFLKGKSSTSSDTHHVYQIYVRIHDEEWNVYRRYTEFHDLHKRLKKQFPILTTYNFPPKKALGNKAAPFVEERRKRLETYLRRLINLVLENNSDLTANVSRESFVQYLPFFGTDSKKKTKQKAKRSNRSEGQGRQGQGSSAASTSQAQSSHQYMGL